MNEDMKVKMLLTMMIPLVSFLFCDRFEIMRKKRHWFIPALIVPTLLGVKVLFF